MNCLKIFFVLFGIFIAFLSYFPLVKESRVKSSPLPYQTIPSLPTKIISSFENLTTYELKCPETILVSHDNTHFFSGTSDGYVVKVDIETKETERVITPRMFGSVVDEADQEKICNGNILNEIKCGRSLGMKFDSKGRLIIANAVFGIFRYNTETKEIEKLAEGGKFYNDVVEGPDGFIYYTTSSETWYRYQLATFILEHKFDGKLHKLNPETKEDVVVVDGLGFANGVDVSYDQKKILFAETLRNSLSEYDLSSGEVSTLIPNIPQHIDNFGVDENGFIYVSGIKRSRLLDWIMSKPKLCENISKFPIIVYALGMKAIFPTDGLVSVYDKTGVLVQSYFDPKGTFFSMTGSAHRHGDYLYIGSVFVQKAVRIPVKEL